jgi:hypothetical protein
MFPGELSCCEGFAASPFGRYIIGNTGDVMFVFMNLYYGENQWVYDGFYEVYKEKLKNIVQ